MGRIGHCRQHILDAGIGVLSTKGYNGTGIKEIVDAAGVPKGSFYNHFASKEAFVVEAIEKEAKASIDWIDNILSDATLTPKHRLLNFFDQSHQFQQEQNFQGGCFIGNLCLEMSDENEAIRSATTGVMCKIISLISHCLAQAQQQGELTKSANPGELAEFMHCAWEGAIMRMKGQRSGQAYDVFRKQISAFFI